MQPTIEILEKIKQNSIKNNDEMFTRLYRYMLRPDIYYVAYQNLYANNGASTEGINTDTADGFSEKKIQSIIKSLDDETYMPSPVRRTYIKKDNGKYRPIGIPTFTDKLVQEVLKMILDAVYEPIFLNCSHGFRPKRSCHTALEYMKKKFTGTRWFIEGDIKGCFDNIDHNILVENINNKIKDMRIIKLIWKFLKAGYCEQWKYHNTYSGTSQGGTISPILANIYLHELDKFVMNIANEFKKPPIRATTYEYGVNRREVAKLRKQVSGVSGEEKEMLLKKIKKTRSELLKLPYKSQTDKELKYIRYADDCIIGINGSKEDCIILKQQLSDFISNSLKMELSEEKTLITHSNEFARFLGYDVRIRRNNKIKRSGKCTKRTLNNMFEINIPLEDKINKFMFDKGIIIQKNGEIRPKERPKLFRCTDLEIVSTYNAEIRGIANYYSLASNFNKLNYFSYLMEYSCLKTLAGKHKSHISKIQNKFKDGKGKWGIPYKTKEGYKRCYFADYTKCRKSNNDNDTLVNIETINTLSRTTFESRLSAKECEICGTTTASEYEIHHVNKVKNLKGKKHWEQIMIAKKRKTIVVCKSCHVNIHNS